DTALRASVAGPRLARNAVLAFGPAHADRASHGVRAGSKAGCRADDSYTQSPAVGSQKVRPHDDYRDRPTDPTRRAHRCRPRSGRQGLTRMAAGPRKRCADYSAMETGGSVEVQGIVLGEVAADTIIRLQ